MANRAEDRFGNPMDPIGYARGTVLDSSVAEIERLRAGNMLAAERALRDGVESIGIFTGNQRKFPLKPEDLDTLADEWIGPSLFDDRLQSVARSHFGGRPDDSAAVFNRTSAAIVAVICSHTEGRPVVSVVLAGNRGHASVHRGANLASVDVHEVDEEHDWQSVITRFRPALVVVTTVTSSLERLDDDVIEEVVTRAKDLGATVLLDEAYGARLRTVLHEGRPSLQFEADLSVTNCDKAGLPGPRAGVLVGRSKNVLRAQAWASEHGMEARAPIAAAVMRSLESYEPSHLRAEAAGGRALTTALKELLGDRLVQASDLGPTLHEDDLHEVVHSRANLEPRSRFVPAETATVVGMLLLHRHGILTVNTHGQPGARVSLRLKPTSGAVSQVGGVDVITKAVDSTMSEAAALLTDGDLFIDAIRGRF